MINEKAFWESKVFWFNIVLTVVSLGAYFQAILPEELVPYAVIVQGVGNVILRVWFTTSETLTAKKKK